MWMDAVALLPLCILGLHKILDGRSGVFYTVCLALVDFYQLLYGYHGLYFYSVFSQGASVNFMRERVFYQ